MNLCLLLTPVDVSLRDAPYDVVAEIL